MMMNNLREKKSPLPLRERVRVRGAWLLFLFLFFSTATAHARQALLSSYFGTVEIQIKNSKQWLKAVPKLFLKEGDKLRTGKRSRATILFQDGSRTEISAETTLVMSQLAAPVNVEQSSGRSRFKISKLGKGFTLRTPTAVCSVRGTEFEVDIQGKGSATNLEVFEGVVNGLKIATGESIDVGAGQTLKLDKTNEPLTTSDQSNGTPAVMSLKELAKKEVGLDMTREQVEAAAAEEMKLAEYQEGKSLIDISGNRVRVEEYILRKPKDVSADLRDKAFKFVVLDKRNDRLDFFSYKGIFNKTLPTDLSIALNNVSGRQIGAEPEFYLTSYEMAQSNLTDAIKDMADGGHLVKVTFDGTTYTLEAHAVASDGKAGAATDVATQLASVGGKFYDPIADVYKDIGASPDGIYDSSNDTFKNMKQGDTLWRTVFNRYAHLMGPASVLNNLNLANAPVGTLSQPWFQYYSPAAGVTNIATLESINNAALTGSGSMITARGKTLTTYADQDIGNASFKYLNGNYAFDSYFPDSTNVDSPKITEALHQRLITYYPKTNIDIPYEQYDTFIISDEGKATPFSAFANATSGKTFKEQLLNWNYEQITQSSAFSDRKIDIVAEPKILIKSGLIK